MRKLILLLSVLIFSDPAAAQDYDSAYVEEDSVEQVYEEGNPFDGMVSSDSLLLERPQTENTVYSRKFKENISSRYKDEDFNYETVKPRESFWERLMRKFERFFGSIFGNDLNSSFSLGKLLLRIFVIILAGFVIYFVIKFLIGKNIGFFGRKNSGTEIKEEDLHENIHEINFAETIAQFENSAEYRLAVRYQFLLILKKLSDKKLISWNPEKTNKEYSYEIKDENLKQKFSDLALIFDYIWYGEFGVDHNSYLKFKEQFQSFKP
ncbi:hypothetical protein ASG31_00695 [Chryseobacterium sp. Leaf404]|uniref:hypothetical protein n=1 Tax=unclassified Chryseobacterium TaxID=2593645 RepID=UPI0006F2A5C0|nr:MULTISPECIES: hypothetical protein [unclassified Chryseobacterium]KQT21895.1 hypothetical protein ASG31_00695 [Chryseobacterium sp. Leaf404]